MATEDLEPITVTAQPLPSNWSLSAPLSPFSRLGDLDALTNTGGGAGIGSSSYTEAPKSRLPITKVSTPVGNLPGVNIPIGNNANIGVGMNPVGSKIGANLNLKFKKGGEVKSSPKKAAPKKAAKPNPMLMAKAAKMAKAPIIKKAAGGAAKVRKGMATPEGKIIDAMNKICGR